MTSKEKLVEATMLSLQGKLIEDNESKLNETITDDILEANEKLKHLKNSQELIDLVEDYLDDNYNKGFPLYLVSKKSRLMLYFGTAIDNNKAHFLVSDFVSTRIVDYRNVYKYYEFSDRCR